jgi:hypothetical protein
MRHFGPMTSANIFGDSTVTQFICAIQLNAVLRGLNFQFDEAPVVQNLDISAVQRHFRSAKPIANTAVTTIDTVGPVIERIFHFIEDVYVKIQPYKPELAIPAIAGLFMIFFGMNRWGPGPASISFRQRQVTSCIALHPRLPY